MDTAYETGHAPREENVADNNTARARPTTIPPELDKSLTPLIKFGTMQPLLGRVVRWVLNNPAESDVWRDHIIRETGMSRDTWEEAVRQERRPPSPPRPPRQASESATARPAPKVAPTPEVGVLLPPPSHPLDVARDLARPRKVGEVYTDTYWRGDLLSWTGAHWEVQSDATYRAWVYKATEKASYLTAKNEVRPWAPTSRTVDQVLDAARTALWLRPEATEPDRDGIPVRNGVVDTLTKELKPHTPTRFNVYSVGLDYNPDATCPHWLGFLDSIMSHDEKAKLFLQEWFGYVLSGRTDLQKIASIYGDKRSGKGTIARTLTALMGPSNVAGPTLGSLAGDFGGETLIGKPLAILSDVVWRVSGVREALEKLKAISGEDAIDINRKYRQHWTGQLPTRFMLFGNNVPQYNDESGAFAARLINVHLPTSFLGREDRELGPRILSELAGVLNWSLDGLTRLTKEGKFTIPATHEGVEEDSEAGTIREFIREFCVLDDNAVGIYQTQVYQKYREWCVGVVRMREYDIPNSRQFTKDFKSALPGLKHDKGRVDRGPSASRFTNLKPRYPGAFNV